MNLPQVIAKCGNTGNSSKPHIHFHVQDGPEFFTSAGIPIVFRDICVSFQNGYSNYDSRKIPDMPLTDKRKAILIVVVLFCIAGIAFKFVGTWENSLVMPYVNQLVPYYFIAQNFINQLELYPKGIILITTILFLIANGLVLPITEEIYFNGYMLPRLQRFNGFVPVL